jgi:hypothetical protein
MRACMSGTTATDAAVPDSLRALALLLLLSTMLAMALTEAS